MIFSYRRIATLALAAALICGFAFPAQSFAKGEVSEFARQMEQLNPEQQTQARAIFDDMIAANAANREAIRAKRMEMANLLKSANPDTARIEALAREIGELKGHELVSNIEMRERLQKAGLPDFGKQTTPSADKRIVRNDNNGKKIERRHNSRLDNLTAEQQATAKKIFSESREAMSPLREAIKTRRAEIASMMRTANPDIAKIESLAAEIGELRGKMLVSHIDMRKDLEKAGIPASTFDRPAKRLPGNR